MERTLQVGGRGEGRAPLGGLGPGPLEPLADVRVAPGPALEKMARDGLAGRPEFDQRPRRLSVQMLSVGRGEVVLDRGRDQLVGDALTVRAQEPRCDQRVVHRTDLREGDAGELRDRVRRDVVADDRPGGGDRSVTRLELGQAPADDGTSLRSEPGRNPLGLTDRGLTMHLDVAGQLPEQPGVAGGGAMGFDAHVDRSLGRWPTDQPGGSHRGQWLGTEHGR